MEIEEIEIMVNNQERIFRKDATIQVNGKITDITISKIMLLPSAHVEITLSSGKVLNFVNYPFYFEVI